MPTPKADSAEALRRIEQAFKSLLDGNATVSVVAALMTQHGISQAQAYKYVKEAMDRIYEKSEHKFEQEFEKHYKRLERLYAMCMKDKDKRTANQVLKQMSALFGLDAPKRVDLTTGGETIQPVIVDVLGTPGAIVKPREVIKESDGTDSSVDGASEAEDTGSGGDGEASQSSDSDPQQGS